MTDTAWEHDHLQDPADTADTYVILDGHDVRLATCTGCGYVECSCCQSCLTWPCRCGEPFTKAEYRAMSARHAGTPRRVHSR
jgi:hypothetical protein